MRVVSLPRGPEEDSLTSGQVDHTPLSSGVCARSLLLLYWRQDTSHSLT